MKLNKNKNKRAFTLIELIAVIVILGVTLSIAVPMVTKAVRKAKLELMENQEEMLELIGKDYFISNRENLPKNVGDISAVSISTLVEEGYTKEVKDYKKEVCDGDKSYIEAIKLDKGEYNYHVYLECDNYETGYLWSEWSDWSEEEPIDNKNTEIETMDFYNYQEATEYWTDWGTWSSANREDKVSPVSEVVGEETQYRYKDQQWKWNNGGGREYAVGYFESDPGGYPNADTTQTSWGIWRDGSATGSSTRQIQYRDLNNPVYSGYSNYDTVPSGYPNRASWDGTIGSWNYWLYDSGYNGQSYSYNSSKTAEMSIRTRSVDWGNWNTLGSGSVTSSSIRNIRYRDKMWRFVKYKYYCYYKQYADNWSTDSKYVYYKYYYSGPSSSTCRNICSIPSSYYYCGCSYVSGSRVSTWGRYDDSFSGYSRYSDWEGNYYDYASYSGTLSYDSNRREVQYQDKNVYSSWSGWSSTTGSYTVSQTLDIAFKEKLYKYYYYTWGPWSALQTSGTYTESGSRDVQYRNKTYKYYKDTLLQCGDPNQYYSESPDPLCGFKDTSETIYTDWRIQTSLPSSEIYRTIEKQTRNKLRDWTGDLLPQYVSLEQFEAQLGKTLTEIEASETLKYTKKPMYRYRTKVY